MAFVRLFGAVPGERQEHVVEAGFAHRDGDRC
jgi:hypothetical protein